MRFSQASNNRTNIPLLLLDGWFTRLMTQIPHVCIEVVPDG